MTDDDKPGAPDRKPATGEPEAAPAAATKPLQLPARDAATPPDGVPTAEPSEASTKPLEMPLREPAPAEGDRPITVELVEENTGVLSLKDDRPAGLSAAAEKIAADKAAAARRAEQEARDRPIMVELVEETTGVLSAVDDRPAQLGTQSRRSAPRAARDDQAVPITAADDIEEAVTSTEDTTASRDEDLVPWVAPDDGFQLADEIGDAPPPLVPTPPVLPSPQEAALEAARIVSEMVDIDSESGAVIATAAAAGAAIEAAVAAQKATSLDPRTSQPGLRAADLAGAPPPSGTDPVSTARLSRDRILAALAHEEGDAASAGGSSPRLRASTRRRWTSASRTTAPAHRSACARPAPHWACSGTSWRSN